MIEFLVRKCKITLLFFIMFVLIGIISLFQLSQQEQPEITVNTAIVTTTFPGASPEEVEQSITKKLEEHINQLHGLKSITSTSSLGQSTIVVETKDGVDPKEEWKELRQKVNDAEVDLPKDAKQPIIQDDLSKAFVQTFGVYADSFDQLYNSRELLKNWKDQLRTIAHVSDVTIEGLPDKQIVVQIDSQKLQQYGISPDQVMIAIQKENEHVPLGGYQVKNRAYQLRLDKIVNVDQFSRTLIKRTKEGQPVYLNDIGTVNFTTERVKQYVYYNGKPAVSISINAEPGADVPSLQKNVDSMISLLVKDKPLWMHVESIYSQNGRIQDLFGELNREMLTAIIAVIFVCTLGLNLITSLVVALAIPISIAVGMIPLPSMGVSLNQISIVGLIIVLGILVDDAVVVNDNIERRLSVLVESPYEAAIQGSKEVSISILTATLATICSFGPLFFLQGDAGQFIRPIPVIISLSMLTSMLMSLTIIPIFRQWYESRRTNGTAAQYRKPAGLLWKQIQFLNQWYTGKLMPRMLAKPLRTGMVGILIGTMAYTLIPFTPIQLFPAANRSEMYVNIQSTSGSNIMETDRIVRGVTTWLMEHPEVKMVASYAGMDAPKMFIGDTTNGGGERGGQIVIRLDSSKVKTADVVEKWNQDLKSRFPEATIAFKELETGPPVGSPVEVRIYGKNLEVLRNLSQQVKEEIVHLPGIKNVQDSYGMDSNNLHFLMNKEVMDQLMVNEDDISRAISLVSEGLLISKFDDGQDLVDMVLKVKENEQDPSKVFQKLTVPNSIGQPIPLSQVVSIMPQYSLGTIDHKNLSRVVSISADIEKGRTATEAMNQVKEKLAKMHWPSGYRFETGGETSQQADIFINMGKLSVIVVFLILILIAMQFYSLSIPFLILSTIYLAFAGSLIGLFITRTPLGFMTMMGVISLAGIVVRNGIVLVEFIEEARHKGAELKEAVIRAGEARFRPILLTTATAVSGLTPLAVTGDVLFRPLAVTIIFGLVFSTILTLVIVPCMYTVMARRKIKRHLIYKRPLAKNENELGV